MSQLILENRVQKILNQQIKKKNKNQIILSIHQISFKKIVILKILMSRSILNLNFLHSKINMKIIAIIVKVLILNNREVAFSKTKLMKAKE